MGLCYLSPFRNLDVYQSVSDMTVHTYDSGRHVIAETSLHTKPVIGVMSIIIVTEAQFLYTLNIWQNRRL